MSSKGGRPPGPIRKYRVECIWPSDPDQKRWREAVSDGNEEAARKSVVTLRKMKFRFRLLITLLEPGTGKIVKPQFLASEWGRMGDLTRHYDNDLVHYVPDWARGLEPLEKPKLEKPKKEVGHDAAA